MSFCPSWFSVCLAGKPVRRVAHADREVGPVGNAYLSKYPKVPCLTPYALSRLLAGKGPLSCRSFGPPARSMLSRPGIKKTSNSTRTQSKGDVNSAAKCLFPWAPPRRLQGQVQSALSRIVHLLNCSRPMRCRNMRLWRHLSSLQPAAETQVPATLRIDHDGTLVLKDELQDGPDSKKNL